MADVQLFGRVAEVTVDTIKVTGHDVSFEIEKTLKSEPNTCTLRIWNLTEDQRSQLEELRPKKGDKRGIPCKIEAGYKDATSLLWLGDLRDVFSIKDGPEWTTELSSGDGERAHQTSRAALSFGPKTSLDTALRAMVRALGVGEGNVSKVAAKLKMGGVGRLLTHGKVISGATSRHLTDFARSADLEWSIQDGAVQFVDRGKSLAGEAIRLAPETGLVGSPTVDNDGVLHASALMIPDIRPGRLVVMDAARIKGNYRIEKVQWVGDTHGQDWYAHIDATRF
jgi:hypothetical protein